MLENYKGLSDGRIRQIDCKPFEYGIKYSNNYNSEKYKSNSERLSCLRLGYILGAIGETPNSVLDVGYGNGDFLKVSSDIIPKCYGYDVSEYPVPNKCVKVDDLFGNYDLITFFDSLEHFDDISFVSFLKCKYICISLPWCHYFSDEWFKNWKHRKVDEHIWYFNEHSLKSFMVSQGYQYITHSNIEDIIRKSETKSYQNILTMVFKKDEK